jgi:hypothetical protein
MRYLGQPLNLKELGVIIIMTAHKSELRIFGNQVWDID